jgi:hypothetical protein
MRDPVVRIFNSVFHFYVSKDARLSPGLTIAMPPCLLCERSVLYPDPEPPRGRLGLMWTEDGVRLFYVCDDCNVADVDINALSGITREREELIQRIEAKLHERPQLSRPSAA